MDILSFGYFYCHPSGPSRPLVSQTGGRLRCVGTQGGVLHMSLLQRHTAYLFGLHLNVSVACVTTSYGLLSLNFCCMALGLGSWPPMHRVFCRGPSVSFPVSFSLSVLLSVCLPPIPSSSLLNQGALVCGCRSTDVKKCKHHQSESHLYVNISSSSPTIRCDLFRVLTVAWIHGLPKVGSRRGG